MPRVVRHAAATAGDNDNFLPAMIHRRAETIEWHMNYRLLSV